MSSSTIPQADSQKPLTFAHVREKVVIFSMAALIHGLDDMGRRRYQRPAVMRTRAASPNQQWYFRARLDALAASGEVKRVEKIYYLGMVREIGKREAEKLRDQILAEAINKPGAVIQSQILFGRVLDEFLELTRLEVRPKTIQSYTYSIDKHFRPVFGKARLCDMTPQLCQRWLSGLKLSRATRNLMLVLFRYVWDRAIQWNYTREVCPLKRASLGPIEAGREKTLPTVDQFRLMLQMLEEPYRTMLLVATFTGLRISEIRGLQWGDIRDCKATIRRTMSQRYGVQEVKTRASARVVPVAHINFDWRIELSQPHAKAPGELIFPSSYDAAQKHLRAAAKAVGIAYEGFGWHTFRRAQKTWSAKKVGMTQADSMAQMGHTTGRVNDMYLIADDEDFERRARAERELMDAVLFGGGKAAKA